MIKWVNILHLYQPANLEADKVVEATAMSYERIVRALEEHPEAGFTLNIAGCLVARWAEEFKYDELISRIRRLVERGQIELLGSAAYHALLPLVSESEAEYQIKEQEEVLKKYFGSQLKLKGFFLPELAYSPAVARLIKRLGYEWLVVDEITGFGRLGRIDWSVRYEDEQSGLVLLFRHRARSESYVPASLLKLAAAPEAQTVVTASDAELYGLRHLDHLAEFEQALKRQDIVTETASAYLAGLAKSARIRPVASSWQSTPAELKQGQPYKLWQDRANPIHRQLWQLAGLADRLEQEHRADPNAWWSRWHLVRGLASCVFWWASGHDFRKVFGPVAWSPDEVEKGVNELIRSIRALEASTDLETKLAAEKLALDLRKNLWRRHWRRYAARR